MLRQVALVYYWFSVCLVSLVAEDFLSLIKYPCSIVIGFTGDLGLDCTPWNFVGQALFKKA